jgi:hypothetical protein
MILRCLDFPCQRLVLCCQFQQPRSGSLIGYAGGKDSIASGTGQQVGGIHAPKGGASGRS